MKFENLKPGDILRAPDGVDWNVDQVILHGNVPVGVLLVKREAIYDLTGWEPVDSWRTTGRENPK